MSDEEREGFKEPWRIFEYEDLHGCMDHMIVDARGWEVDSLSADERKVACVNACRGLPDPEAAIGRLVEAAVRGLKDLNEDGVLLRYTPESVAGLDKALAPFLAARKERDK